MEVPLRKKGRKAWEKESTHKARERGTGDPPHTLGLADITRHTLERDPGGRCCNLNFPEGSSSAAPGKNNNTWSVSRTAHRNVARGTRAGCQPNASARTFDLLNSNNNTYSFSRAAAHPARCSQADCQALRALGERKQCTSESVSSAIF